MKIPLRLRNPDFRFFITGKNRKSPNEKKWNTKNNYMFCETKLKSHLFFGGNIGLCTGYGGLVVIDFDDKDYQYSKKPHLPKTFTVKTAIKGLHHMYYILKGNMISKVGIDLKGKRVADIQAGKCCVCCPPSTIKGKSYSIIDNSKIAEIGVDTLTAVFGIDKVKPVNTRKYKKEVHPEKIQQSIDLFLQLKILRTNSRHFQCPFHRMMGAGNMYVFDDGSIYCFHCQRRWDDAVHFMKEYSELKRVNECEIKLKEMVI